MLDFVFGDICSESTGFAALVLLTLSDLPKEESDKTFKFDFIDDSWDAVSFVHSSILWCVDDIFCIFLGSILVVPVSLFFWLSLIVAGLCLCRRSDAAAGAIDAWITDTSDADGDGLLADDVTVDLLDWFESVLVLPPASLFNRASRKLPRSTEIISRGIK